METVAIIDTNQDNIHQYGMCGYKNTKHEGLQNKIAWAKQRYSEGMKYKILYSEQDGAVGGIEYIPGEFTWRPIHADGYMVIHCIYIMTKKYKEKGYGLQMLKECIRDTKEQNKNGVAVVSRKGTWMAKKELFLKEGFQVVDQLKPDFQLLALSFNSEAPKPKFLDLKQESDDQQNSGLTIYTSHQCPYTAKAVNEITEVAKEAFGLEPNIRELTNCHEARNTPGGFGVFSILYNGKLITENPISKTRFKNIMNKIL